MSGLGVLKTPFLLRNFFESAAALRAFSPVFMRDKIATPTYVELDPISESDAKFFGFDLSKGKSPVRLKLHWMEATSGVDGDAFAYEVREHNRVLFPRPNGFGYKVLDDSKLMPASEGKAYSYCDARDALVRFNAQMREQFPQSDTQPHQAIWYSSFKKNEAALADLSPSS